jgi:hypothetical protein
MVYIGRADVLIHEEASLNGASPAVPAAQVLPALEVRALGQVLVGLPVEAWAPLEVRAWVVEPAGPEVQAVAPVLVAGPAERGVPPEVRVGPPVWVAVLPARFAAPGGTAGPAAEQALKVRLPDPVVPGDLPSEAELPVPVLKEEFPVQADLAFREELPDPASEEELPDPVVPVLKAVALCPAAGPALTAFAVQA